jgi:tRNA1(Val) A37 N6-methylase TrmN6
VSEDRLLDGRVRLAQPENGYRAAIDPVFLAAAVPARAGQRVLDVGCGTGAAALCLAARVAGLAIDGIELQAPLGRLARDNAAANGLGDRFRVMIGDIADPPPELKRGTYDHVMANPPHLEAAHGHPPADASKAMANRLSDVDLEQWVAFCLAQARPKGSVTFIHRADRLDRLIACLSPGTGGMVIFPLWPAPFNGNAGKPAKRVLVQARKGSHAPARLAPGLVVHETDGAYTPAAQEVLRQGRALSL